MENIGNIILGILIPFAGTTLGAACVYFMRNGIRQNVEKGLLGFASGVMVAASVWSLLIPSMNLSADLGRLAFLPAVTGFFCGILFLLFLDGHVPHLHIGCDEPEGPSCTLKKNTMLVLAVTLHNIPEGIAVAMPIYFSTNSKRKAFKYTFLSGVAEPIGALLAFLVLRPFMNAMLLGIVFSVVAGIMIYIAIEELIPSSRQYGHDRMALISTLTGVCIMPLTQMIH